MAEQAYALIRSARRTLALELRPDGTLLVRAPRQMPAAEIDRFVAGRAGWIAAARERQARRDAVRCDADPAVLRTRAEAELPPLLAEWAARMGVEPRGLRITAAERRLGSCSADDRICLSQNLMRWPAEVIEYVVVHELAHIRHKNHGPAFYAEIAKFLPDYRRALAILRGK